MGLTLVEKLDRIFGKRSNFDISGMCDPELVTVQLAKELREAYMEPGGWQKLVRAGYDMQALVLATGESGIIGKWITSGRGHKEHLKLYWDQTYPKEIERQKAGDQPTTMDT